MAKHAGKKSKVLTTMVTLDDCLNAVLEGRALYDSAAGAVLRLPLELDRDAARNFVLETYTSPAEITPSYTVISAVATSPAAIHYAGQVNGERYVSQQLFQGIEEGKITKESAQAFASAYDTYHTSGDAHASFHKWEIVPHLVCCIFNEDIRNIMMVYPMIRSRDGKARQSWYTQHESVINSYFAEPLDIREERLLAKLVGWCFFTYGQKQKQLDMAKNRYAAMVKAEAAKIEANRLPGDNVLTAALKKVHLVPEEQTA